MKVRRLSTVEPARDGVWNFRYQWSDKSRAIADRLEFVARADELAEQDVAMLLVVGALDDAERFLEPAEQLRRALSRRSPERTSLAQIPEMGHALAEEPGLEPAPQTGHASQVDAIIVEWFRRHLNGSADR